MIFRRRRRRINPQFDGIRFAALLLGLAYLFAATDTLGTFKILGNIAVQADAAVHGLKNQSSLKAQEKADE